MALEYYTLNQFYLIIRPKYIIRYFFNILKHSKSDKKYIYKGGGIIYFPPKKTLLP